MYYYQRSYSSISPYEGRQLLNQYPYIILIDVRSPEEYAAGHIKGSINIPLDYLSWQIDNFMLSPYTPIMVYCKTGIRASTAAGLLVTKGFINVFNLGGIQNWPYEIVR